MKEMGRVSVEVEVRLEDLSSAEVYCISGAAAVKTLVEEESGGTGCAAAAGVHGSKSYRLT
jgi:hypothetical protein